MPKPPSTNSEVISLPENDRQQRRRWTKDEKLRIVREAEACNQRGAIGAFLRREGLYSSLLRQWRHLVAAEGEAGLTAKQTGRKPTSNNADTELVRLRRHAARLEHERKVAKAVIGLPKKVHEVLGLALPAESEVEKEWTLKPEKTPAPRHSKARSDQTERGMDVGHEQAAHAHRWYFSQPLSHPRSL